jgi:hypothetical protein
VAAHRRGRCRANKDVRQDKIARAFDKAVVMRVKNRVSAELAALEPKLRASHLSLHWAAVYSAGELLHARSLRTGFDAWHALSEWSRAPFQNSAATILVQAVLAP